MSFFLQDDIQIDSQRENETPTLRRPSTSTASSSVHQPAEKKRKRTGGQERDSIENQVDEALFDVKRLEKEIACRDHNDTFGEYVGQELKRFDALEQSVLKKKIQDLIHEADLKRIADIPPNVTVQILE